MILACRNAEKGESARAKIVAGQPSAKVEMRVLDVADLDSVRRFAAEFLSEGRPLDLLINNAGVMAIPERRTTPQGFEMQFGTNHLGHFALTGLLLPALLRQPESRVVTVASIAHKGGKLNFDDLNAERVTIRAAPISSRSWRTWSSAWSSTGGCERTLRRRRA